MPRPPRLLVLPLSAVSSVALLGGVSIASGQLQTPPSTGDRVLGLDISAWQGNLSQAQWDGFYAQDREFVFLRASRGGTTGYYDQSNADNNPPTNTLSQRYDDPYFVQNITRATAAGMLAGPYHFGRMDIIASTTNAKGIPNDGTDEANHFIEMAGAWMRPGYLLPVFDFEAGSGARTGQQLAQFAIDFSNRIYAVKGIRPIIYIGSNYVNTVGNTTALAQTYPNLWMPRYVNQTDPDSIPVQTAHIDNYSSVNYGAWKTASNPQPWKIWQYASQGHLTGYNGNLDFDVAQGNIEFMKDMLTPAVWVSATGGDWSTMLNWNSGQDSARPIAGPGQVTPAGVTAANWNSTYKPVARLPNAGDNVDLERATENITVTLASGAQSVRRIDINERLNVTGGSLNAALTGQVGAGGTLSMSGGNVTFTQGYVNNGGVLDFSGAGTLNVGTLFLAGNPTFTGTTGTGQILAKAGVANPLLDLQGATRTFTVGNGSASTDMRIAIPLANGGTLAKDGDGALELTGNNSASTANVSVNRGHLLLTANNQLGINGVVQNQTDAATDFGGTVRLSGNGLTYNVPLTIHGSGAAVGSSTGGAIENVSGNNTWSGPINLGGTGGSINNQFLNQINSTAGALTLSGVIQKKAGMTGAAVTWAKTGDGDVVLTGPSPNTYDGLTRVFGGRLIIEKDGALGTAGSSTVAAANTFQLGGAASSIAFRAPGASPGLNYNTVEWIFTDGTGIGAGVNAQGQIDNLGGNNSFAGHVGLGGPTVNGTVESYLGVSAGSLELKGGIYAKSQSGPAARNIFKRGGGALIFAGDSAGTPTNNGQGNPQGQAGALANSSFTIQSGTVQLKGTAGNTANLPGVTSWNMPIGGTLAIAKTGAAGGASLNFTGGTLRTDAALAESNAITLGAGGGTIHSNGFDSAFSGPVTGTGGLTKIGIGNVTLAGAVNGFAGSLAVNNGTLAVAQSGADASVANINGLTLTGGGRLDLADNDLLVRTTSTAAVESLVATGRNGGTWDGANGIGSSTAHWIYSLGVASNADLELSTYAGHTGLTGAETIVRYTTVGDADLSGIVNGLDFLLFQSGFDNTNPDAWHFGDFNYSGIVDAEDFQLYVTGFLNQPNNGPIPQSFYDDMTTFADANGIDRSFIPEPGGFALLAMGAGMMMRRTRRRGD